MTVYINEYTRKKLIGRTFLPVHETFIKSQEIASGAIAVASDVFDTETQYIDVTAPIGRDIFISFGSTLALASAAATRVFILRGTTRTFYVLSLDPKQIVIRDV